MTGMAEQPDDPVLIVDGPNGPTAPDYATVPLLMLCDASNAGDPAATAELRRRVAASAT